jgi:hypothetical protein
MDDLAKYRVILSGSVVPGFDRAEVLANLAEVFNSSTEMMDRLLRDEAVPLRKEYDKDKAKLICKKVRSAGAHCTLQQIPEIEITLSDDDLTGKLHSKKCPACQNLLEESWTKCPGCGYLLKGARGSGEPGVSVPGRSAAAGSVHSGSSRETKLQELVIRFVNSNTEYYKSQFQKFGNPRKPEFKVSWNWPAFFFFFFWALYRKMWIWAGVHMLGGIAMMFLVNPGPVYLIWVFIWPVTANYLYFRIAASTAILAREAPDFKDKFLDKGDGSLLEDISSSSSELAKTSRKLSGLATSIKILLVTDKSKTNQEAISTFVNQLIAGEVLDGWGSAIRVEQHVDQYIIG